MRGKGGRRIYLPPRETNDIRNEEEGKERGECTLENARRRRKGREEESDLFAFDGKKNLAVDTHRRERDEES